MIAPDSESYPVQGAAIYSGVDYALALEWVWHVGDNAYIDALKARIIERHGERAFYAMVHRTNLAWKRGHLRIRRRPNGGWARR